jgi:hypothetical protein
MVPEKTIWDIEARLWLFDQATQRQRERELKRPQTSTPDNDRGWTREKLYP